MLAMLSVCLPTFADDTVSKLDGRWLCPIESEQEGVVFKIALYNEFDTKTMKYISKGINSMYLDSPEPFAQYSSLESGTFKVKDNLLTFNLERVQFKAINDPEKILTEELFSVMEKSYTDNNDPVKIISIADNIRISSDPVSGQSSECYKI